MKAFPHMGRPYLRQECPYVRHEGLISDRSVLMSDMKALSQTERPYLIHEVLISDMKALSQTGVALSQT